MKTYWTSGKNAGRPRGPCPRGSHHSLLPQWESCTSLRQPWKPTTLPLAEPPLIWGECKTSKWQLCLQRRVGNRRDLEGQSVYRQLARGLVLTGMSCRAEQSRNWDAQKPRSVSSQGREQREATLPISWPRACTHTERRKLEPGQTRVHPWSHTLIYWRVVEAGAVQARPLSNRWLTTELCRHRDKPDSALLKNKNEN